MTTPNDNSLPGNTNTGRSSRSKTWFITDFETFEPIHFEKAEYWISCLDTSKPEHGSKKHLHQLVHFKNAISFNTIKKAYPKGHIEKPRDIYDCISYIKNNVNGRKYDVKEFGIEPKNTRFATIKEVKEMTPEQREDMGIQYLKAIEQINRKEKDENNFLNMLEEIEHDELKAPTIIYITGGTGKGKTYKAYKLALEKYDKHDIGKLTLKNEFFDVINESAKCYVIEEFRPSQIKASDFLQLTDKYGYRANVKGGFVSLRPEMIIICSIIRPEKIYKEEVNQQFIRRITEIVDLDYDKDAD